MDVWVVAAAAAAGCLAKYWQNVLMEKEGLSEPFLGNSINEKSRPEVSMGNQPVAQKKMEPQTSGGCDQSFFFGKRVQRPLDEVASSNREGVPLSLVESCADALHLDVPISSANEIASTSGTDGRSLSNSVKYVDSNVFSFSNSQSPLFRKDNDQGGDIVNNNSGHESNNQAYLLQPHLYPRKTGTGYEFRRDRSFLNYKWSRGYSVKPRNSLESCLIAQLYKENTEVEEYVYSSLPSPSTPIMRPLVITDGNQIISKACYRSLGGCFGNGQLMLHTENGEDSRQKEAGDSILPLSHVGLIELPRKLKKEKTNIHHTCRSRKQSQSQGLPEGMLLFCLGISIGVVSTILSSKKEVDELNDLLKQTQNLVQDLHEELEMKDSVTMKELVNEACIFQEMYSPDTKESKDSLPCQAAALFSSDRVADGSMQLDDKKAYVQGEREKLELMSKIEAELEAELERLELNINASSLERRLSDLGELDPDIVAEVVRGELGPDMISGGAPDSDHDSGGSSSNDTHPANYAVSPRELSLRLHELIQSRLEEQISELESALEDSQKLLRFMEARRDFSNSDLGSPSTPTQESPTRMEQADVISSPLYLNLAGDALNAYDEAYAKFMSVNEAKEEDPPSTINGCKEKDDGVHLLNQIPYHDWMGKENGSLRNFEIDGTPLLQNGIREKAVDDYEDEMGTLLIKQVVEKTRQGSHVVLNAQRILFSMDDEQ